MTAAPTDAPPFTSYVDTLLTVFARDPDRSVITSADGQDVTAGDLHATVHRMAAVLRTHGVDRGRTVSVLSRNRPESLAARYAVNLLGARVVLLYEGMAAETLSRMVESVETVLLLVDPDLHDTARALLDGCTGSRPEAMTFGPPPGDAAPLGPDLLAAAAALPATPTVAGAVRPEDDWCIRHTGGTTGIPKGVRMTHGPFAGMIAQLADSGAGEPPRLLACTSLAHMAGIMADVTLVAGGSVVLHRDFDPTAVLAAVARERITQLWLLPPLLYRLLDDPTLPTTDIGSLTRILYGGCTASAPRMRQAAEVFGPVLYGCYGQSEAMAITQAGPADHADIRIDAPMTVGRPMPGVTLAIRDAEGRDLPPGEPGEVHVHSAGAMRGYWKRPDLTAQVLRDGWVHTGDVGYLDTDGRLYLVDRLKDVIIVVGGHVHPSELEDLLHTHPAVVHAAAYGVRTPDETEEVHLAVVPAPGRAADEVSLTALRTFVTAHKGALYAPAAVHLLDAIPLTPVGKPDKKLLRARPVPTP
ncbi:AMP-binding protein [Streptomyces noursei]|uniref:AMP-binding protein n=1 Tax=Streptomyces noursei TaxID=1971 RepID=UPI001673CC19|nr:AMP-binding protein [Streptomyces noursei]MCZ1015369.1 AMP-binding protein [Streptomyces noursei]GGX16919.1 fatty acid CoA ligase [Streptomyces noursei]